MKRRLFQAILLSCLICMMTPACSQAASIKGFAEKVKIAAQKAAQETRHNFWFWSSEEYTCYAQWERVSGGVNFRIKMENEFPYDSVDAYTFEISAKDVYEEPILLKSSDGDYCSSLYYTGERTFKPETNGYTEYFKLRSSDKIRYVCVKLVKYHTDEGTVEVDESHQKQYTWKIN
ncbi:MAG: hypothetical protein IJ313_07055 [Clostridia bacterium]|nr:hypothetical protein [Clostridia bacterium]